MPQTGLLLRVILSTFTMNPLSLTVVAEISNSSFTLSQSEFRQPVLQFLLGSSPASTTFSLDISRAR